MGVDDKICVVDDDDDDDVDRGGGVNESLSSWPRCSRAVRLSDAFCFLMTRLDAPDLSGRLLLCVIGWMILEPWKEDNAAAVGRSMMIDIILVRWFVILKKPFGKIIITYEQAV